MTRPPRDNVGRPATVGDLRLLEASLREAFTYSRPRPAPPNDLDAERRVLGAYLAPGGDSDADLVGFAPRDFYSEVHSEIWQLAEAGNAEELGRRFRDDLRDIAAMPATCKPRRYIERVQSLARRRRALEVIVRAEVSLRNPDDGNVDDVIAGIIAALEEISP